MRYLSLILFSLCVSYVVADFKYISDKDVDRIEQEWAKDEEVSYIYIYVYVCVAFRSRFVWLM